MPEQATLLKPPMSLDDLRHTERIVRLHLGPVFDRESIASDIMLESWTKGEPRPSLAFIRFRCIDAMRARAKESDVMHEAALIHHTNEPSDESLTELDSKLVVDRLTRQLDNQERKLIYLRFWLNLTMESCAERLGVNPSVARLTLLRALDKMKDAV